MNRRLLERVGGKAVRDGGWRCRELGWWGEVDLGGGGGEGGKGGRGGGMSHRRAVRRA